MIIFSISFDLHVNSMCAFVKKKQYLFNISTNRTSVRLGEYDISNDPDCSTSGFCAPTVINHMISHVIIHPDYKQGQYHHDIALVILKTPLNYTGELRSKYIVELYFGRFTPSSNQIII